MTSATMRSAMHRMRVDATTTEVVEALAAAGVPAILLKGPSIATWLYDGDGARVYGDTDLLVPPDRHARAEGIIRGLGFEAVSSSAHASTWRRSPERSVVDLHRSLPGARAEPAIVWEVAGAHTATMTIGGTSCLVLDRDALAAHIAMHAAWHRASVGQPVEDLRRAVERLGSDDWMRAAAVAAEIGATSEFAIGLRIDRRGEAVATRLGLPEATSVDLLLLAASAPAPARGLARAARTPGVAARVALVARELAPPPSFMRTWRPVARRGRAGLALAYVLRPLWLVAHLPAALLAWRRAVGRG